MVKIECLRLAIENVCVGYNNSTNDSCQTVVLPIPRSKCKLVYNKSSDAFAIQLQTLSFDHGVLKNLDVVLRI